MPQHLRQLVPRGIGEVVPYGTIVSLVWLIEDGKKGDRGDARGLGVCMYVVDMACA